MKTRTTCGTRRRGHRNSFCSLAQLGAAVAVLSAALFCYSAAAATGIVAGGRYQLFETTPTILGGVWTGADNVFFFDVQGTLKMARIAPNGALLEFRAIGPAPAHTNFIDDTHVRIAHDNQGFLLIARGVRNITAYRYSNDLVLISSAVIASAGESVYRMSEMVRVGNKYVVAWNVESLDDARFTAFDESLVLQTPPDGMIAISLDPNEQIWDVALAWNGSTLLLGSIQEPYCMFPACGWGSVYVTPFDANLNQLAASTLLDLTESNVNLATNGETFLVNMSTALLADGTPSRQPRYEHYEGYDVSASGTEYLSMFDSLAGEQRAALTLERFTPRGRKRAGTFIHSYASGSYRSPRSAMVTRPGTAIGWGPLGYRVVSLTGALTTTPTAVDAPGKMIVVNGLTFALGDEAIFGTTTERENTPAIVSGGNVYVPFNDELASPGTLSNLTIFNEDGDRALQYDTILYNYSDVQSTHPLQSFVESITRAHLTAGCGGGNFCPDSSLTRAQAAVMLLSAKNGWDYIPPEATGTMFGDVAVSGFAAAFIEQFARDGITAGCGGGNYCPDSSMTRSQAAVFLLRSKEGAAFVPPPATGQFADVPASSAFAPWVEELARRGITGGCGGGNYCPDTPITRGQMAVFLKMTFGLS